MIREILLKIAYLLTHHLINQNKQNCPQVLIRTNNYNKNLKNNSNKKPYKKLFQKLLKKSDPIKMNSSQEISWF